MNEPSQITSASHAAVYAFLEFEHSFSCEKHTKRYKQWSVRLCLIRDNISILAATWEAG